MRTLLLLLVAVVLQVASANDKLETTDPAIEKGRYLTQIAACGDCHTPGYMLTGEIDESVWLTGDKLGFAGEWGTTYAANLRLRLAEMNEDSWVKYAQTMRPRPPMPWFNLAAMTEEDLRAIYRYVRFLGPAGEQAPDYLPPGKVADGPVLQFPLPPPTAANDE